MYVAAPIQSRTWAHSEWCAGWDSLSDRPRTAPRSSTRRPLTILKKPFDNIEVLQLASALTEKWRVAEVARRRVQDLETPVELTTDALQRSKNAAAANPATCHRAISGKSRPLEAADEPRRRASLRNLLGQGQGPRRACCQGAARRLKVRNPIRADAGDPEAGCRKATPD